MAKKRKRVFSDWERDAWRPPPEETIDEWAERTLILPRGVSSIAGPLSLELTPYLRGPLRAVTDPETEEVVLCTSSQVGKTTFLLIVALYFLENDPWNLFHVMPTEDEALEVKAERYLPIIRESPQLARFIEKGGRGQFAGDAIRLNGCTITFRGSHSASGLASKPAKIAIADEIDKWDAWAGGEADPVDLLGERMKTFHDAKYLKCSTPTTKYGRIWAELRRSSDERYHVPCPLCGEYQVLVFGDGSPNSPGIKWPEGVRDPDRIDGENLAWYECVKCHERIEERNKRQMVMAGVWAPQGVRVRPDGTLESQPKRPYRRRGYHLWAGYSLWPKASWSKIVAKFLRSKDASSLLMNFRNSWLAELWEVTVNELKTEHIRARCGDYWVGELPEGADTVVFGVDVQSVGDRTYHYYVVRAWGTQGRSWLIRYGVTAGWEQLYSVVFEHDYRCSDGQQARRIRPVIDSGYRTAEVYDWCFTNDGIAYKGDARTRRHFNVTEIPRAPESDELVELVSVNPNFYKWELHRLIKQPDKWHLPREMDEEYCNHMVAEQLAQKIDKRTGKQVLEWRLRSDGMANHYFDCEVMALVAADLAEIGNRPERGVRADQTETEGSAQVRPAAGVHRETVEIF